MSNRSFQFEDKLHSEEILEIMAFLGEELKGKVLGVDICDFNPTNEDFRTGNLISAMVYYFLLGRAMGEEGLLG